MGSGSRPLFTRPTERRIRPSRVLAVFLVASICTTGGAWLGRWVGANHPVGFATDITVDGVPSGVYRLSVGSPGVTELATAAKVHDATYHGPLTGDQVASEAAGWAAACALWTDLGVFGVDQGLTCATATDRPALGHAGMASGPSAGLAHALVFADWHFDITGDVAVAATGEVHTTAVTNPETGAVTHSTGVHPIGGVAEKTAAAAEAGVDLLVVPVDQALEFFAAVADLGVSIDVVAAPTLTSAVYAVCARSRTEVCVERVLTIE